MTTQNQNKTIIKDVPNKGRGVFANQSFELVGGLPLFDKVSYSFAPIRSFPFS
jgi:hypothetical protein